MSLARRPELRFSFWMIISCVFRKQEEGTTEDNCIRTMLVAAGCLAFAYLIPKTDIPRDFEHSVLASPILAKLCVDVLRISSEVSHNRSSIGFRTSVHLARGVRRLFSSHACLTALNGTGLLCFHRQSYWTVRACCGCCRSTGRRIRRSSAWRGPLRKPVCDVICIPTGVC